jgi:hypothetical protein
MRVIEIRPMAHPRNKWGVYHIPAQKFIASYPTELEAYRFAFGYLEEFVERLTTLPAQAVQVIELPPAAGGLGQGEPPFTRATFGSNGRD